MDQPCPPARRGIWSTRPQ